MIRNRRYAISLCAVLGACSNLPIRADQAAIIAMPTQQSFAEVTGVLARALGPREILLAPDVLTQSSILALEQGSSAAPTASGRVLDMPERFELVLNGDRCFLVRLSTAERWELHQTDCVPAAP
jgi:hypothetical protein